MTIPCCEGKAIYRRCTCSAEQKRYRRLCKLLGVENKERSERDLRGAIAKMEPMAKRRKQWEEQALESKHNVVSELRLYRADLVGRLQGEEGEAAGTLNARIDAVDAAIALLIQAAEQHP